MSYSPLTRTSFHDEHDLPISPPPSWRRTRIWERVFSYLPFIRTASTHRGGRWKNEEWPDDEEGEVGSSRNRWGDRSGMSPRWMALGGGALLLFGIALARERWTERRDRRLAVGESLKKGWRYEGAELRLKHHYEGEHFLEGWDFFDKEDPTHGQVTYVNATFATANDLVYTSPQGSTILSIDQMSNLDLDEPRTSVRLHSKEVVNMGDLIIVDIAHAPYGCSVWPSFWMYGELLERWPLQGEIDVYEGVNYRDRNLYSLHTTKGCTRTTALQLGNITGSDVCNADVETGGDYNGCSTQDHKGTLGKSASRLQPEVNFAHSSMLPAFNDADGGVFVTMISEEGIFIWRWSRDFIPADITSRKPDPAAWGLPTASWLSETCDVPKYFHDMNLIFDITTCGDWAGDSGVWGAHGNAMCNTAFPTCAHAVQDGSNFVEAFFDVNYLSIYEL